MKKWVKIGLPFTRTRSAGEKTDPEGCRGCPGWNLPCLARNGLPDFATVKPPRRIDGQPGAPGVTRSNQPHACSDTAIPSAALIGDRVLLTVHTEQSGDQRQV